MPSTLTCTGSLDSIIDQVARLPPAVERILAFSLHEGSTARHLSEVCERDSDLSARILRLANSPTLGCRQPVNRVLQAAVVLGMGRIRNVVLAAHLVRTVPAPGGMIGPVRFWRHSFAVATLAREIGVGARSRLAEDMFLAGLIHDLGVCVLAELDPHAFEVACASALERAALPGMVDSPCLDEAHAQVPAISARIASRWPLERRVIEAVGPRLATSHEELSAEAREVRESLLLAVRTCRHEGAGLLTDRGLCSTRGASGSPRPTGIESLRASYSAVAQAAEDFQNIASA